MQPRRKEEQTMIESKPPIIEGLERMNKLMNDETILENVMTVDEDDEQ